MLNEKVSIPLHRLTSIKLEVGIILELRNNKVIKVLAKAQLIKEFIQGSINGHFNKSSTFVQ